MEYKREQKKICMECQYAKHKFQESCYCSLYGITIGYSKTKCEGYEHEQVRQPEDGD